MAPRQGCPGPRPWLAPDCWIVVERCNALGAAPPCTRTERRRLHTIALKGTGRCAPSAGRLLPAAARLVSAVQLWDMSLPGEVDEGGRMVPPVEA